MARGSTGVNAMSSARTGGTVTIARFARTVRPARDDTDAVAVLDDPADRRAEHDAAAEAVGDALGDDLRAAREPRLLRAVAAS